jgi:tetratricopeptide (TPR) repeat protein
MLLRHRFRSLYRLLALGCVAPAALAVGFGCDVNRIAADQTAKVAAAGADGVNGFWDYEVAGMAMPGAIMQSEVLVKVSPNNEALLLGLARTYVAYTFGWVQDEWELADEAGDFERADRLERRVRLFYERATELALRAVRMRDEEGKLDEQLKTGKVEVVKPYLARVFTEQEDVSALYWAGLAWGSAMANSGGDVRVIADAPVARALLERSVELDPAFADAGGLGILGSVEAMFPALFGGNLDKAKAYFERALEVCKRKNHLILVGYAKNYAVNAQDRELFIKLLREVLDAPDQGVDVRLSNKVARHRAERYIKRVDDWFDPALE